MGDRLYPRSSGSSAISPAFNGGSITWELTTGASRFPLSRVQGETAFSAVGISRGSTNLSTAYDVLTGQWVSPAIGAMSFTTSDSFKSQFRASENFGSADMIMQIVVWISKPDGTSRGILYSGDATSAVNAHEFSTTMQNRQTPGGGSKNFTANVTSVDGDYIVVEVGYRSFTASAARTGTIEIGGNISTDLPEDETTTAQDNPWIEFSQTITWSSPAKIGSDSAAGSDTAAIGNPSPSAADAGSGSDAAVIGTIKTAADASSGPDAASVNARVTATDAGSGSDGASVATGGGGSTMQPQTDVFIDYRDGALDGDAVENHGWFYSSTVQQVQSGKMTVESPDWPDAAFMDSNLWSASDIPADGHPVMEAYGRWYALPPKVAPQAGHNACFGIYIQHTYGNPSDEGVAAEIEWDNSAGQYCLSIQAEGREALNPTMIGSRYYLGSTGPTPPYCVWIRYTGTQYELRFVEVASTVLPQDAAYPSSPQCSGVFSSPPSDQFNAEGIGFLHWLTADEDLLFDVLGGGPITTDSTQPGVSDTSSGSDATTQRATPSSADASSGSDSAAVPARLTAADVGSGDDVIVTVGAALSAADSSASSETNSLHATLSPADSASASDASAMSALQALSDSSAGADDVTVRASLRADDVCSSDDLIADLSARVTAADLGTSADGASVFVQPDNREFSVADSGLSADDAIVHRRLSVADLSSGDDESSRAHRLVVGDPIPAGRIARPASGDLAASSQGHDATSDSGTVERKADWT